MIALPMAKLVESHGTQYMAAAVILSGTTPVVVVVVILYCKDNPYYFCYRVDGVDVWILEIR